MLGIKTRKHFEKQFEPMADYGFFGPDSVTWKVWSYPTSYVVGFARAVSIEHGDPNLAAAAVQSGGVQYRTHSRYGRTLRYFGMVAFAAAEPTVKVSDVLVKIHSKAIGHDPVTGGEYDANKPSSQLWILITAWHSILLAYEKFGPGRLTEAEENQFWAECAIAAQLQTIDPDTVPRSREEVRAYFEGWRPHLAASEEAKLQVQYMLRLTPALPPDFPAWKKLALKPAMTVLRAAIISTIPRYQRDMFAIQQSALVDVAVVWPAKLLHRALYSNMQLRLWFMGVLAPAAISVAAPAFLGLPPLSDKVWGVREAQEHFGFDIPSEAHPRFRAKQRERVFDKGEEPSVEGLVESQAHLGSLDNNNPAKLG